MAPYDRDPTAIDPRTQGSAVRTFFMFVVITVIIIAAFAGVYAYMSGPNTLAQNVPSQSEPSPTLSPPATPAPPAAVPNPNPPPEPAPGPTVPDQGKPAEPGQPTPPGTGN